MLHNVHPHLVAQSDDLRGLGVASVCNSSEVRFGSVKIVRPFCYRIITFFVVNKFITKVVEKVKRIVDAILGD
jgi:hypothetical protein